jgi:hypothetical protein
VFFRRWFGNRRDRDSEVVDISGIDEHGNPMGKEELTAEALTQLFVQVFLHPGSRCELKSRRVCRIAGSDTTSNSSCAITFWITKHPQVHAKLLQELDEKFKDYDGVLDYEDVKELPYLDACINVGGEVWARSWVRAMVSWFGRRAGSASTTLDERAWTPQIVSLDEATGCDMTEN